MLKDKADILLFLIFLTFAEKIVIVNTCLISTVKLLWLSKFHLILVICLEVWRSISNKISGNNISKNHVWRSIVLAIKKSKLSYTSVATYSLKYLADWNPTKMKYKGKGPKALCMDIVYFLSKISEHGNILISILRFYRFEINSSWKNSLTKHILLYEWGWKKWYS